MHEGGESEIRKRTEEIDVDCTWPIDRFVSDKRQPKTQETKPNTCRFASSVEASVAASLHFVSASFNNLNVL